MQKSISAISYMARAEDMLLSTYATLLEQLNEFVVIKYMLWGVSLPSIKSVNMGEISAACIGKRWMIKY